MSDMKQAPGGDAKPLPNNFSGALSSNAKKNAPKVSGSSGGNATGPGFEGVDRSSRNGK
jgi:hypothetical protein